MSHKPPLAATLALLEVQTRLELSVELGVPIEARELIPLIMKLETARNTLQRTLLRAAEILENGATS